MAFDRFLIGPLSVGLETDLKPFMIPDEAMAQLSNAYVFRGRVRKRFGSRLLGDQKLSRLRIALTGGAAVGITDGAGAATGTVPGAIFKVGQMFSIGDALYTVSNGAAGAQPMLQTVATTTATYDIGTGVYVFNGAPATTQIYFYPAEPVMGLTLYEKGSVNNHAAYAFDTQFAYVYGGGGWARSLTGANPVWHGDDTDFFWVTNWQGITDDQIVLFVTNFQVTNYNGVVAATDDSLWTFDGTTWTEFTPKFLTTGEKVKTARIIVPFKNRLVLLNTVELDAAAANNINYPNRCRFSQNGSPFEGGLPLCATAWLEQGQAGSHQAGFIDAPTEEEIVSAEFIKDRLIVYFERSTWELAYTGNEIQPFIWQKINTELGSESTFSSVPFDKEILTVGTTGVHTCNGANVARVDNKIPDQVFQIRNTNSGPGRVAGIRDYFAEMVYWSFPNSSQAALQTYPNKILVYNYKNGSWAINDDCITAFGYFEQQTGLTWAQATFPWASATVTWGSGTLQADYRQILAGNQEGFTFLVVPEGLNQGSNALAMQLTNMTYDSATTEMILTIVDHTLSVGEYIKISGALGVTYTGLGIYKVTSRTDTNIVRVLLTFADPDTAPSFTGTYTGGGTVARVSKIDILTKQWNFYQNVGKNVYIQKIDFNITKTSQGQITIDYYPSSTNESMIAQASATGAAMGNSVLETSPYTLVPLEEQQNQLWHPIFFQTDGETVQLRIYLNDDQLKNPTIAESFFELNAMLLYAQQISRLQ